MIPLVEESEARQLLKIKSKDKEKEIFINWVYRENINLSLDNFCDIAKVIRSLVHVRHFILTGWRELLECKSVEFDNSWKFKHCKSKDKKFQVSLPWK